MPGNESTEQAGPSRRRVLTYGTAAVAGGVVGTSRTDIGAATADDSDPADSSGSSPLEGAMYSYQYRPGSRFTVVEAGLDWRPDGLDSSARANVVSYGRSRSFRAFVFTDAELPGPGRTFELESAGRAGLASPDGNLVRVEFSADR